MNSNKEEMGMQINNLEQKVKQKLLDLIQNV